MIDKIYDKFSSQSQMNNTVAELNFLCVVELRMGVSYNLVITKMRKTKSYGG